MILASTPGGYVITDVLAYGVMGGHPSACVQATNGTTWAVWWLRTSMIQITVTPVTSS